jgi:opacity protein-like surface antigen
MERMVGGPEHAVYRGKGLSLLESDSQATAMKTSALTTVALLALLCAFEATAQERPVQWHFAGGYSITSGTTGNYLDDGWMLSGGVTWTPDPSRHLAIMAELHFSSYGATSELIKLGNLSQNSVRINDGWGDIFGGNVNAVYKIPFNERVHGYVTAGIGEYYRKVRLTQTVLVGGTYCDPWWGICYPGVFPGQAIVAEEGTTRFAWNAGGGVEFPMSNGGSFFVDVRYHALQTKTNTEFIPIQIGIRF